ncbi:MAG: AMP-binding protein [Coriobacteriales bacterium]|jgi:long-chain acyl-CoA synthetase|nr:AMP-binding protein [Coriobacteriales bacterium]
MEPREWHKQYPGEIPPSFEYPHFTMKQYFNESARRYPNRPFLVFHDAVITFEEANAFARKLANGLMAQGCKKRDRVVIAANNIPEFVIAIQACYKFGGIAVPTNPRYTTRELEYILKDSQAETIIIIDTMLKKVLEVCGGGQVAIKRIVVISEQKIELTVQQGAGCVDLLSYDEVVFNGESTEPAVEVFSNDCALLQYTGGTTGIPKGCVLTQSNLEATVFGWFSWYTHPLASDEYPVILCPVPLYHIYGLVGNISLANYAGGTILLMDSLAADDVLCTLAKHPPNLLCVVPYALIFLLNHPAFPYIDISSIKVIGVGGDSLPKGVSTELERITGKRAVVGYGLTETAGSVCGQPIGVEAKEGSIGLPLPDVDARIMSLEDPGTEVPCGQLGELVVKGPQVMTGYWGQPEETALVLKDGWLSTGDIGYRDKEGWIFLKDRKKDMIIHSGFNVYPKEIDEVLSAHPAIQDACTIGIPSTEKGETVKSFIVLNPGEKLSAEEVMDYCHRYLVGYKVPKVVEFIDQLPKTAVGKPNRVALRQRS